MWFPQIVFFSDFGPLLDVMIGCSVAARAEKDCRAEGLQDDDTKDLIFCNGLSDGRCTMCQDNILMRKNTRGQQLSRSA